MSTATLEKSTGTRNGGRTPSWRTKFLEIKALPVGNGDGTITTSDLAIVFDIAPATLRLWVKKGILPKPKDTGVLAGSPKLHSLEAIRKTLKRAGNENF